MISALLRKTFNDALWLLLACTGVLFTFGWIRVIIVSSVELYQLQRVANNLPEVIQRMSPVPLDRLVSYPALVTFTYEEPLAYLIMAVWTVSRGSDCISGEIGRGTMEMLLAQPVSRMRYLMSHTFITLLGILVLAGAAHLGTRVGVQTSRITLPASAGRVNVPFFRVKNDSPDEKEDVRYIPISRFIAGAPFWVATVNFACLGVLLLGLSTFMSSWDRYRWRTIGIVVGFYIVETVIELTGMAVEGWGWLLNFTFFSAYEPVAFVTESARNPETPWLFWASESTGRFADLGPIGCNGVLLLLGFGGLIAGAIVFWRRDIPAPL